MIRAAALAACLALAGCTGASWEATLRGAAVGAINGAIGAQKPPADMADDKLERMVAYCFASAAVVTVVDPTVPELTDLGRAYCEAILLEDARRLAGGEDG